MNKNIKRIIALVFAVGAVAGVGPAANYNLFVTKAYAANDNADELDSIYLQDDDGDSLDLYTDDDYEDEFNDDLEEGDTYYAKSSTDYVTIDSISGADDDKVRIFVGSDEYEVGDSIPVEDGVTTLKVRVYEDDYDEDENYDSSDYNEYKIKVEYNGDDESYNDEDALDSLELKDGDGDIIDLYSDSDYEDEVAGDEVDEGETYSAKTSSDVVNIETSGPDDEYIRVFKSTSDSAKGMETGDDISVSQDKTLVVRVYSEKPDDDIEYEDDSNVIGEYKIKLEYTGDDSSSSTKTEDTALTKTSNEDSTLNTTNNNTASNVTPISTSSLSTATTPVSNVKTNQWVQVNGYWKYNDESGTPLKDKWHFDGNYGKWYYLGNDGIMAANRWIQTGGKWYYVGTDGAMLTNTTVSGYKVGADGAWVQ